MINFRKEFSSLIREEEIKLKIASMAVILLVWAAGAYFLVAVIRFFKVLTSGELYLGIWLVIADVGRGGTFLLIAAAMIFVYARNREKK